ncbi:MAG: HD domain-containing protein, partial [Bacteroidota bacterium]
MTEPALFKKRYDAELQRIVTRHHHGVSRMSTSRALSLRLDSLIESLYTGSTSSVKQKLALVAVGGYGRRELCFASDADIMFLVRNDAHKETATPAVKELLHALLDCGVSVGHSFRTIDECTELSESDFESWVALLEARLLCGNRALFLDFQRALGRRITRKNSSSFVRQLLATLEMRHQKYGSSTKLLEPNVKNSAGGLRDIHFLLWLFRGTGAFTPDTRTSRKGTVAALLRSPGIRKIVSRQLIIESRGAFNFLLRVRNEMHLQAQGLHDTLEFSSQRRVAEALRYTSVEQFMQDYYIAARAVARINERAAGWAHETFLTPHRRSAAWTVHPKFTLRDRQLGFRRRTAKLTSRDALEAALLCVEFDAHFSSALEDLLYCSPSSLRPIRSNDEAHLFLKLMNSPNQLGRVLHRLNDLGVLSRLIPEWKPMVGFFQHNIYHYYTADEHTLVAIDHAERLNGTAADIGELFRNLPRRDILYLACLLHDIAKPRHAVDHQVEGAKIAKTILRRLNADEIADDVLFLVRHHLLMEQVAFRRNLSDPQTISDFASKFRQPAQLDYLYLLTYADLSAVNTNVWTDWKGMLLAELYHKTRPVLSGKVSPEQLHEDATLRNAATKESIIRSLAENVPPSDTRVHLDAVQSPEYLSAFTPDEIAHHIELIRARSLTSTIFKHRNDFTEVTMIAQDAPFALSKFCGVLT